MDILIVDQDAGVREQIKAFCAHEDEVDVVSEADTGAKGIQAAESLRPDLLYVGARLPDQTGFDVLRALRGRPQHRSILVTNRVKDGSTAIAAGAIGYLVKPLTQDALGESLLSALRRITPRTAATRKEAPEFIHGVTELRPPMFLVGERDHRLYPLDPVQIDFVESAGNYVKYHLAQHSYIARESIKRLTAMLAQVGFIRIERSLLVNVRAIAYAQTIGHGTFAFTLTSEQRLLSGYSYRDDILSALPLRRRVPRADRSQENPPGGTTKARAETKVAIPRTSNA
jgi:two-component system LytT family response regulator